MYRQSLLPGFPDGAQKITTWLSILEKDGSVTYFLGRDNYFSHPTGDRKSERFTLTSLMENGHVRACDLEQPPLNIPHRTLMHWKAQYRKDGPASFFREHEGPRPPVMTPEKSAECAGLLADGRRPSEVARLAGIKDSTLRKALGRRGVPRLAKVPASNDQQAIGSSKSERSPRDVLRVRLVSAFCRATTTAGAVVVPLCVPRGDPGGDRDPGRQGDSGR